MPSFGKKTFHQFLLRFKKNDTVNIEGNVFTILVVIKPEFSIQSL